VFVFCFRNINISSKNAGYYCQFLREGWRNENCHTSSVLYYFMGVCIQKLILRQISQFRSGGTEPESSSPFAASQRRDWGPNPYFFHRKLSTRSVHELSSDPSHNLSQDSLLKSRPDSAANSWDYRSTDSSSELCYNLLNGSSCYFQNNYWNNCRRDLPVCQGALAYPVLRKLRVDAPAMTRSETHGIS
jgi:hypothetical protein